MPMWEMLKYSPVTLLDAEDGAPCAQAEAIMASFHWAGDNVL